MAQLGYRGIYNNSITKPYRISRSKIELFTECPRCFWLETTKGIKRPSTPPFLINSAVDTLLKKEFDTYRSKGEQHPLQVSFKIDAKPYQHVELDTWRENFVGIQYLHKPTNLVIFGAVDDVWINSKEELIVVDYKATAKEKEITNLNPIGSWHDTYRRQMEVYQWLLRQNDFAVSDTGYFVYANGILSADGFFDKVTFKTNVIPYVGKAEWVEPKLGHLKTCLERTDMPANSITCSYCTYVGSRLQLTWQYMQQRGDK